MCGVAFLFAPATPDEALRQRTGRALARMTHRGPDEQGTSVGPEWAMGHCRLSIIDLGGSRQPMESADGRYHLVYNGEIYNYADLRARLEHRWEFQSAGDTEVLLAGLALDGPRFLESMEGMWAFAFWDARENRLLLARDRMGKKPLYYTMRGGGLACASDVGTRTWTAPRITCATATTCPGRRPTAG
jgi:asparagine synthase (glutamine-hydrolysing)